MSVTPRGRNQPADEYNQKSEIEKAVVDAIYVFQGVLGEGHYSELKTRSLYQLKGMEVNRARYALRQALEADKIRWGDTPTIYVERLENAARKAITRLRKVNVTKTNAERIDNVIGQLEHVEEYTKQAQADAEAAKAQKISEEMIRFPEDGTRGQEIQMWSMCLTKALDIIQYFGGDPNADGEGIWDWTPSALATHFSDIREEREDYREELGDIINALDDENIEGAWHLMYDFAEKRKGNR